MDNRYIPTPLQIMVFVIWMGGIAFSLVIWAVIIMWGLGWVLEFFAEVRPAACQYLTPHDCTAYIQELSK